MNQTSYQMGIGPDLLSTEPKLGYSALYKRNEFLHELADKEIKGLILEETGASSESNVPGLVLSCIKAIRAYADFNAKPEDTLVEESSSMIGSPIPFYEENGLPKRQSGAVEGVGLSVGYNIHLNLPPTTDIGVFNAIFKSLKEHLLTGDNG